MAMFVRMRIIELRVTGEITHVKFVKFCRSLLLAAGMSVLVLQSTAQVFAATSKAPAATPGGNNSLKITPIRSDVTIKPGDSGTVKVQVTNLTTAPVTLKAIENDFVAGDENGTPAVILDENSYAPSHSLKRFMVPIANVNVAPNQTSEATVKIVVPKNAQAGGYFGALRFAPAGAGNQPVSVASSVTSLILLTVPGPTVERLTLTNFDVQQNGGSATNFRTPNNLSLLLRFKNDGNLQEGPFGQVNVQKGKKVVYSYNFNINAPRDQILPDSARRWLIPVKGFGKFGKYTVSGTFGYGAKGETINITKTIWIIPSAVIMAIVIGIVVIIAIVGGLWLFLRNYKRRILKSSRRRY
jgi:hypothetical protein